MWWLPGVEILTYAHPTDFTSSDLQEDLNNRIQPPPPWQLLPAHLQHAGLLGVSKWSIPKHGMFPQKNSHSESILASLGLGVLRILRKRRWVDQNSQQMPANASKLGQKEALEQALAFPKLQVPLQSAHTSGNTDIITDILFPYFLKPLDAQNHLKSGWKIHLQVYLNDNMLKPRRKHSQVVLGDSLKLATCPWQRSTFVVSVPGFEETAVSCTSQPVIGVLFDLGQINHQQPVLVGWFAMFKVSASTGESETERASSSSFRAAAQQSAQSLPAPAISCPRPSTGNGSWHQISTPPKKNLWG